MEMAPKEGVEKAISLLNGKTLMDRPLTIDEARPQKKGGSEFRGRTNRSR